MDGRELIRNILTKKPTDRMGFADKIWWETDQKWRQQGGMQRKNEETGEMTQVDFSTWFDADMREYWDPVDWIPIRGFNEVLEENDKWIITKYGSGAVFKNWKTKTGVPEHTRFDMNSMEVWQEVYKPHLLSFNEKGSIPPAFSILSKSFRRTISPRNSVVPAFGSIFVTLWATIGF